MALIEKLINNYVNNDKLPPGIALAVIKKGECVYQNTLGYGNLENSIKVTLDSNFYLASVSKTFTGVAILLLLHEGRLKLEDFITDYLKDLPDCCQGITIGHLLNHTSGLLDYFGYYYDNSILNEKTNDDVYTFVNSFEGLEFAVGSKFNYSNTGYSLLAMIIEEVSGKSYSDFLRDSIFKPANMNSTLVFTKNRPLVPNRTYGYKKNDTGYSCFDYSLLTYGDGGIYSNINDLINWSNAIDRNTILPQEYKDIMFTRGKINNGTEIGYGCGWFIENHDNKKYVYHTGGAYGFRTFMGKLLEDELSVIVLTNCAHKPWGEICDNIPKFMLEIKELY